MYHPLALVSNRNNTRLRLRHAYEEVDRSTLRCHENHCGPLKSAPESPLCDHSDVFVEV